MIKLSRFEKLQKERNALSFKPIIDDLVDSNLETFLSKVEKIEEWDRPREDLFIWIPVLNKIDSILSDIVKKYNYSVVDSKLKAVRLVPMDLEDENTVVILTEFTCRLLYHTENRYIYSSMDVMNDLLNCPNFKVKYGAIKVLAIIGERYIIARERLETLCKSTLPEMKNKALHLALALPSSSSNDSSEQFTLADLFFNNKKYPSKWSRFKFTYYNNPHNKENNNNNKINSQNSGSSMRRIVFNNDDLKKFSLKQLFEKGMEVLPPDTWYNYSLKVTIAKAFSEDTSENIELRSIIVQTKFIAVAFINTTFIPPHVSSKLFEVDPYTFNCLTDFISLTESRIPGKLRLDALFALECISLKHVWCSDIMRNLGGNLSHGVLFQILRQIGKLIRNEVNNDEDFNEEYNVRFFYLISNLAEVKTLHDSLLAAGLIPSLLEIISAKNSLYKRTKASATHLLEVFINDVDSTAELINYNGFTLLIDFVTEQVNVGLADAKTENNLQLSTIDFLIPYRQQAFIKSLLKLVLKLLKIDSGDRIRNLIDSPILGSLLHILKNMEIFGSTLASFTLDVIQRVINCEPTIYSVLVEAGIIPYIIENFSKFMIPHSELLYLLPDVISALCLNNEGLKEVKERNLIDYLFKAILNPKYARELSWKEEATDLGTALDELARHYPDLKPGIVKSFCETVKEIPSHLNFSVVFLHKPKSGGNCFYHSREEPVLNNEENGTQLDFWDEQDSSVIIDCFSNLLYGMTLDNSTLDKLPEVLNVEDLYNVIIPTSAPFDYTSSQAMLNITDVLQILDEHHSGYNFLVFLEHLHKRLGDIKEFLTSPNETSYFLGIEKDDQKIIQASRVVDNLNSISSILYIITNVYVTLMTLSNSRVQEIIDFFQKESNLDLLTNLGILFQKAGLEEMYIRSHLPDEVVTQTTPDVFGHTPPIHIHRTKPVKNELKDNFTSAKFKNTFQIRNILIRIQSCIAMLLRCFLRLSHATSMDLISQDKVTELRIFETIIQQLCSMVDVAANLENTSYILVLLHFNTYVMTFPKTTIATTEIIQTIPAYLFYQKGGYQLYTNILLKLFRMLTEFTDMEAVEKIDYLEDREEVLIVSAVTNILTFFNKSIQQESMESIRTISNYYVNILDYNVTKSLMKRLKIRTLKLLSMLGQIFNIFHSVKRPIPYGVFKQILTLWKNSYTMNHEADSDKLYMIEWDLIIPSERKVSLLVKVGVDENVARNYLESHRNRLPSTETELSIISPEQRKHFKSFLELENSMNPELLTDDDIPGKDLEELRKEVYNENLKTKVFDILPLYPKLVNAIAKTLIQIFTCISLPIADFTHAMLNQIQVVGIEDEFKISSFVHLFGIFLNEGFVYQQSINLMDDFVSQLKQLLKPEYVNKTWFSKFLYCYEIILSKSELPIYETPADGISLRYKLVPMLPVYRIKENLKQCIFKSLIKITEISNFYSALAVSRVLLIYARERSYAIDIINSGILSRLLKAIGTFQKYDKINFLESSFLLLVRRCFESDEYVSNIITSEIDKSFTSRTLGSQKEKERDLAGLLEEKPHVVMRNPTLFTNILSETARFDDFGSDDVLLNFTMRRHQELKKEVTEENRGDWQPSTPTGIIHLLLSQLMAAAKKDWISEPTTDNGKSKEMDKDSRHNLTKNHVCTYMIFLLKMLAELISSYKQCKYEFLTYSRKNIYTERPRHRSTALNFFLYQLLDKSSSQDQNKEESKRKEVISMLAKSVLVGFLTSVNNASNDAIDPKKADGDLTFIRKFVIETLVKVLKSASSTSKLLEQNVDKLDAWFNIISSMVYVQAPYLRVMIDSNKIEADRYQICRLMIDLNVPAVITECMSKLDLNYPFCKKLFNNAVETLNAINCTRSDFANYFKVETHEEDVDVDEESEREEVSNMFQNSTLGMYDVEDVEEEDPEDDEDDSLIGEDEGIAFVNDDDEGYEVVFSEDEGDDNDEGTADSLSSGSSVEEVVFEVGPDEISDEDMEDVESEADFSNSEVDEGYSDNDSEQFDDEVQDYDSDIDIDISDYYDEESDWESGLTDLTTSEEDSDTNNDNYEDISPVRLGNGRAIWSLGNGVELEEEISDEEEQGVFHGIQHVFNPDDQFLFRVHEGSNRGYNQRRVFHRHPNSSMIPPSMSLLNGNRRNQSNLINPLGPSGLEQVENDITTQLTTVGTGVRPRTGRPHFADVLFSGEVLDERILDGIVMKSTLARWKDIFDMFYDSKNYANYLIPSILNRLFRPSLELYQSSQRKRQERIEKLKEERSKRQKVSPEISTVDDHQILGDNNHVQVNPVLDVASDGQQDNPHLQEQEPIYVNIEGTEVNIAGTDIDPEFLNALPEDMRAEVLVQHIRERRADVVHGNTSSREVGSEFLNSLPEDIRNEILEQEAAEERLSNVIRRADESNTEENEDFNMLQDEEDDNDAHETSSIHDTVEVQEEQGTEEQKKKQGKVYFEPLIDRQGTAALMKSVFIVQPYIQREIYHELFLKLCSSKQNRNDIVNILLMILQEGAVDQNSLERIYGMIVARSQGNTRTSNSAVKQLPPDTTPLTVANQAIEILQYLIDSDSKIKFFFITEHENLLVSRNKRDDSKMKDKLPIRYLFSLFERKLITDETVLMDLLTNILQTCTKPFPAMLKNKNSNASKKKFNIPSFDAEELTKIVSIIRLDSCNTKVFQQTLNILYHLCAAEGSFNIFTEELSKIVKDTAVALIDDINELTKEVESVNFGNELDVDLVQKLTLPSSEQAKLLKVLTAVDYLYTHKKAEDDCNAVELINLYNKMDLGKLWLSLSGCMSAFEKKKNLSTSATLLLPVIESLMIISKHCSMTNSGSKLTSYREEKLEDLENVNVENLFVPFTDQHKKLLNQMIRSNPKLMSGPFSLLIKNSKVLDFDNKRYYFIAKIRLDSHERPKLPITVRRDQVFLDSYRALFFKTNEEIKNSKLEITFKGESGVDAGGLTREWYQVLSRQMFNPDYALFLPVASDKTTFHPNRTSGINPEHLSFFKFSGMIIAKAIRDQCFLDCHFSREVYKNILGKPVSLKDMESLDPDYYKSLVWILENDITDIIEETFSVETDDYGERKVIDLIENGRNIAVTEANKQEYVKKIVEYKLNTSVKEQMDNFLVGFYALIPKDLIGIFDEQEVELLISGLPDIDVDDWKNNTTYVNYTASCKQVNYFWRAVRSFDVEERAKLLQFVTGTSKVPLNGFKELSGVNGTCKFSIHRDYGSVERLPSSHTCFNQLNLPAYSSYEALRSALLHAINEGSEGFGLA